MLGLLKFKDEALIFCFIKLTFYLLLNAGSDVETNEITPYKFTDTDREKGIVTYTIPASSRFTTKRLGINVPDIIYYLSKPQSASYAIAIMCTGSSGPDNIESVIHIHRYFLQECKDLGVAVLTVEQWGVDGNEVNATEFMEHYTRSQRLEDHRAVIEHLKLKPPSGWNGEIILLGVSEGGLIVNNLTTEYSELIRATINWCGAGDWPWREELWVFLQQMLIDNPECSHQLKLTECSECLSSFPSREAYDALMNETISNPTSEYYFWGMTYKYHADALLYPQIDYKKIRTPFLVVAGVQDTIIDSSDAFVEKAKNEGAPITYLRVSDMDHYVRKRPDIIEQSFEWLKKQKHSKLIGR